MLYLAEVKSQNRGFVGGYKTELKLLASQAADQTWNGVAGEEIVTTDAIAEQTGKGTLYIINVDNNKQIQGSPELAGSRIVNYLRHFSRTLEKSKAQEEEIEEWKTSLRIQGEEIAKRQAELDQIQQLLQQQQEEFTQLEKEKENLSGAWEELREQQRLIAENKSVIAEVKNKLDHILNTIPESVLNGSAIQIIRSSIDNQQQLFDNYWQNFDTVKNSLAQKEQELAEKQEQIEHTRQELETAENNLQKAIIGLQSDHNLLKEKESSLAQINTYLEGISRLDQEVAFLADDTEDMDIDFQNLESMPLGNLEEIVNKIQQETAKLVNFVNLQEEELTLQADEVKEIQGKIEKAGEVDKFSLESELAEAQEAMKLLNETLVGQRRTLKKQQKILNEHLKILTRRKGLMDVDFGETINLRPILAEIEAHRTSIQHQRDKLSQEVNALRQEMASIEQSISVQRQKCQEIKTLLQQKETQYLTLTQEIVQLRTQRVFLEKELHPIQEQLNNIRNSTQTVELASQQFATLVHELRSMF